MQTLPRHTNDELAADWVTGETIALAEQARLARIQRMTNNRDLRKQAIVHSELVATFIRMSLWKEPRE